MTMSSAPGDGFGFRDSQRILVVVSEHWNVVAALQTVVNSFDTMLNEDAGCPTASRWPELDSHAMATRSRSLFPALAVISTLFPKVLPSQIQAFTSLLVPSAPISPIWLLPFREARLINRYWTSVACPASSRYCSTLHAPPT